ncbi:MAG: cobalamin-binding protein [Thermomicrobium sp.]|nr:cobalamin-binding protein [Thermomicrobium sp.]
MRIVSLLPSLTEIVWALGLADELVAVTHECDYPPAVRSKPRITRSLVPPGLDHAAIDTAVRERVAAGLPLYELDLQALRTLAPDLILTQDLCPVCAVSVEDVCRIAATLPRPPRVVSVQPMRLSEILASIEAVGEATGRPATARALVAALGQRLDWVRQRLSGADTRPRVVCLEWLAPPIVAGHWVPDMVELAGGVDALGVAGQPSYTVTWEQVAAAAPDVLVVMPCGYDLAGSRELGQRYLSDPALQEIPAVARDRVWAVDASSYFSRPGPRVVHGVEILAALLHPERCMTDTSALAAPVAVAASHVRYEPAG